MEIDTKIIKAVACSILKIELTVGRDLKESVSLYVDAYAIFIKENFIKFSLSFVNPIQVHLTYGYPMPLLLWDIKREKIIINQLGRNEESEVDYSHLFSGNMMENYISNKDNMIIGEILIYPRSA